MANSHIIAACGTIARFRNVSIVIHTRDHAPPHVHVIGPGAEEIFEISPLKLISNFGFSKKAIGLTEDFLNEDLEILMEAWNEIHEEK